MKRDDVAKLRLENWPLPDEYLLELGRVSSTWNALESLLNLCLGKLAGFDHTDYRSFVLLAHASVPQKLDALGALCEQLSRDYPQLADYRSVIGKLRSAQKARNRFVHGNFAPNESTGRVEMAVGSARGSLKTKVEPVDRLDIRQAAIDIDEASRSLYKLVLGRSIPPIWETRT